MDKTIENVRYRGRETVSGNLHTKSIDVVGLDTEADINGNTFLLCTSKGDFFKYTQYPQCFFNRRYRGTKFVVYNLKYEEGALLQFLPRDSLYELWDTGKTEYDGYKIRTIPRKMLSIARNKHAIQVYDMYQFFEMSLNAASKKYLGEEKIHIETKRFTAQYIVDNWENIVKYCIKDAVLVERLAYYLIRTFERFGIHPTKLYSTAYVSYQYFKSKCTYITVKRYWDRDRKVLEYAMNAYKGGKFEVTRKGIDYYYEYDIVSAYPAEIANLVDIQYGRVVYSEKYRRYAVYGFLLVRMKLPVNIYSPVALKMCGINIYPVGEIETYITKQEYEYLIENNVDITIIDAVWIHVDGKRYPYRKEIERLVELKTAYKQPGKELEYHTVKILMNSLYGKFVQLIEKKGYLEASSCWNPVYGAVITANVRIIVSSMQQKYDSVVAVHTDSIISTKEIPGLNDKQLGKFVYECQGEGVILGSGIYQIGDKCRFRGFNSREDILTIIQKGGKYIYIEDTHAHSWREVVFHNWDIEKINLFEKYCKKVRVDFDTKRIWLNDWKSYNDVLQRSVLSVPRYSSRFSI